MKLILITVLLLISTPAYSSDCQEIKDWCRFEIDRVSERTLVATITTPEGEKHELWNEPNPDPFWLSVILQTCLDMLEEYDCLENNNKLSKGVTQ